MCCNLIIISQGFSGPTNLGCDLHENFFAFFFLLLDEREKLEGLELFYHPAPGSDKAQIKGFSLA